VLAGALLAACTSSGSGSSSSPSAGSTGTAASAGKPMTLRVMEFNIEYGGTGVDFDSVPKAIQAAKADVVGVEEEYGNVPRIAKALGWKYYDVSTGILSRYPLIHPPDSPGTVSMVEIAPGRVVAMGNLHLPSILYGPGKVARGMQPDALEAQEERVRAPFLQPTLGSLQALVQQGIPSFLTGDFNSPSGLDWTEEMVGARPQIEYAFDWPTSRAVLAAGFKDSFREVHPDPKAVPGLTWPSGRPKIKGAWNPSPKAPQDRIDIVYQAGDATPTSAEVVGESGGPGVDIAVDPWPTDHRATVTTFTVTPGAPPPFVSVMPNLVQTHTEVARYHTDEPVAKIVFEHAPDSSGANTSIVASGTDGTVVVPGDELGVYTVKALGASGGVLASTEMTVADPSQKPVLTTDAPSYPAGKRIQVSWQYAPGNRWDWVGVYRQGADPNVASYQAWQYTKATVNGSTTIDKSARGSWPLPPGKYSVYLLQDDSYVVLARADFIVEG
jgi:hypothetical protein